ncbi:MAG: AAA family ATPase [Nannocystis sp.]|uniref:AAA family ATPase n=1 Tax=Nannocystis sp. TaxID=1962667 RepID=UPI0024249137|nr:AAA family ATPase [Nannocystis sp.]MBK9754230.1 AAA family ATPase [Nannocystis sp.]
MPGVKLKHLKIHQYRNVRPGTELRFDDGINLVLGQNGSGKTTLLGLIACVASRSLASLENEAFDLEYTLANEKHSATIHVRNTFIEKPDERRSGYEASYEASLSQHAPPEAVTLTGTHTSTNVTIDGVSTTLPPLSPFHRDYLSENLEQLDPLPLWAGEATELLFLDSVFRFDESLDAFLAMTGRPPVSQTSGTPNTAFLRITQFGDREASPRSLNFTPLRLGALVTHAHDSPAGELRVTAGPEGNEDRSALNFLVAVAAAMGVREAAWRPLIAQIENPPNGKLRKFDIRGSAFTFTRNDGRTITHDLLSYGQKRLLAFFYYLAATPAYVIADELVNGLHHRWIAACMEAIGDRQAFLTSQNPLLFEYVEFRSIEQVQSCFITCKSELVDGAEQLVWQNMSERDARNFFESYQAGIESPGDILMTRGLW